MKKQRVQMVEHSVDELEQFRDGIRFFALRALGDPDLAAEVAQDTLVRALSALHERTGADAPRNLQAYVLGIARNVIAAQISGRSREARLQTSYCRLREAPVGALDRLVQDELVLRLREALATLSPTDREILRMAYSDGLKSADIAQRLDKPGYLVRKRKSRAIARLRTAFFSLAGAPPAIERREMRIA